MGYFRILEYVLLVFALLGGVLSVRQLWQWYSEYQESRIDSFLSIERHGVRLIEKIRSDGFDPDMVVGIGRSGAFLGGWLAGNLGSIPITVIDRRFDLNQAGVLNFPTAETDFRNICDSLKHMQDPGVLIVEGATTSGSTLREFQRLQILYAPQLNCRYAVLYEVETSKFDVQYVAKRITQAPSRYPWHKTVDWQKHIRRQSTVKLLS